MLITREDMITRFGETELAQRTGRDGYDNIDYAVLDTAIADAEAEAGAYLKAANLSFDTVPHVLKLKVCDIARYYLYEDGYNQAVDERYRAAVAWFKPWLKTRICSTGHARRQMPAVMPSTPTGNPTYGIGSKS